MIVDRLENLAMYAPVHPALAKIVAYLRQQNLLDLPIGKHILNDATYILRDSYDAKPLSECVFEGHQKYADIQIVLSGEEILGYAPKSRSSIAITAPYSSEKDVEKYALIPGFTEVKLFAGMFAIVFPEDLHMPKYAGSTPNHIEKATIKFKL
jgi:YhcH/YjgK/YiaL family protein